MMDYSVSPEGAEILDMMPHRAPRKGTFELTVRCNLHCKMCLFRHADCENADLIRNELTASQWIDMARQAADAGTLQLLITGGEPMLRPDFCEIWEGIYKQGFIITLYTNATLVSDKVMETLRKYPPHKIGITIYGASAETYEKVCGNGAAFERMLAGVHRLKTLPSALEFRTTIIRDNRDDLIPIERLVKSEFGQEHTINMSRRIFPAIRGACADIRACRLTPDETYRLYLDLIREKTRTIMGESFDPNNYQLHFRKDSPETQECAAERFSLLGCPAGMKSYTISWNGKLLGCQLLDVFSTDTVELGFEKAWQMFPFYVKLPPPNPKCSTCDAAEYCQSCLASRYAEGGRLDACSEYMRLEAKTNQQYANAFSL